MALIWGFKLLRRDTGFLWRSILLLWISFVGLMVTQVVQTSTYDFLEQRAHDSLAGDVAVSAFRPIEDSEKTTILEILKPTRESHQVEIMTMLSHRGESLLAELKFIDKQFPLYGKFEFKSAAIDKTVGAWVYPEVLEQLQLQLGDSLQIGKLSLPITAVITDDPGFSQTTSGIAPRVYLPMDQLALTQLTQPGAQVVHRFYYKIEASKDEIEARVKRLERVSKNRQLFVRTPDDGMRFLETALEYFRRFVATLSLLVVGLSFLVAGFQFQKWLTNQTRFAVILMNLGASYRQIFILTAVQIGTLTFTSWTLAWLSIKATAFLTNNYFLHWFPIGAKVVVPQAPGYTLVFALLIAELTLLVFWKKLQGLTPALLLQEESEQSFQLSGQRHWSIALLGALIFTTTLIEVFGDFNAALSFTLAILAFAVAVWLINKFLFSQLNYLSSHRRLTLRLPILSLSRLSFSSLIVVVFSYLVVVVLTTAPQLKTSLIEEIYGQSQHEQKPSLFFLNIPETTLNEVHTTLTGKNLHLEDVSPFILAQLRKQNGQSVTQSWFKKYPVRLSYREHFLSSEFISEGDKQWTHYDSKQKHPWISVEKDFAVRNGFNLGDVLTFDVQGLEIDAEIHSFRRVKWTSFQPNFFIQFQTGVLEEAPKTFIGTLKLKDGEESKLQFEMAKKFPGISIINIGQTVKRILELAGKVITPIEILTLFTIILSLGLMGGIVRQNLLARVDELKVLQTVGASSKDIMRLLVTEFSIITLAALIFGSALGVLASKFVAWKFLNLPLFFDLPTTLTSLIIFALGILALNYQTARSVVTTELKIKS